MTEEEEMLLAEGKNYEHAEGAVSASPIEKLLCCSSLIRSAITTLEKEKVTVCCK